jgi:hypothetical protein
MDQRTIGDESQESPQQSKEGILIGFTTMEIRHVIWDFFFPGFFSHIFYRIFFGFFPGFFPDFKKTIGTS